MPEDPIERINVDLEVFAIPQTPGMPPMTNTVMHVRRRQDGAAERAVMGCRRFRVSRVSVARRGWCIRGPALCRNSRVSR